MRACRTRSNEWYEFTNVNPKNRLGGDCVIRAVALACDQTWEQTARELFEMGLKEGRVMNDSKLYPKYLKKKGFIECNEPHEHDNTKMSIREFLRSAGQPLGCFVCNAGSHHVTCVKDGKVRDIWDCSLQTMHRWWRKP